MAKGRTVKKKASTTTRGKTPEPKKTAAKVEPASKKPSSPGKPAAKSSAAAKKPAAKKAAAEKAAAEKPVAKKPVAKKPAAKKTAAPAKKKTAAAKKPAAAAAKKPAAPTKKPAAPTKKPAAPTKKPAAAKKGSAPRKQAPAPGPSERAIEAVSQLPTERPLTDEERDAMANVSQMAKRFLASEGSPSDIVRRIAAFIDEVRAGRPEPKSNDVRLGLGALWGDQVRAQVGWRWVHLTYKDLAFSSYALVPDDRAFACFPLNRIPDLLLGNANTSFVLFEKIRTGDLPPRKANAYLVIG